MQSTNYLFPGSVADAAATTATCIPLYPLRFEPILQYRLWGGRRLGEWIGARLPGDEPIGEAWLLSDRDDFPSRVADGPLTGQTLSQLMEHSSEQILGELSGQFQRFPLLLKFLDVQKMLSVQVHPPDDQADLIPAGETGKTEAWVVLESQPNGRVYAGLKAGATASTLRSLSVRAANECLPGFTPVAGQGVFIKAGTVHALGDGVVVFEVQQNSDVTFRLYDGDHIDQKTGHKRALQTEKALACIDFTQGAIGPVVPISQLAWPFVREQIFNCPHFRLWRILATEPLTVGIAGAPHILVCVAGGGDVRSRGVDYRMTKGTVMLLPAAVGACCFRPESNVTLLEIAIPAHL
jgi:mannose-6-phosphate isomerase